MKTRLLVLALFLVAPLLSFAQTTPKFVYCDLTGLERFGSTKVTVSVDFGQKTKYADTRLKDETTGKPMVFYSMIDALNYMAKLGWEFTQAYTIQNSSAGQNFTHYLMKKPFDELDDESKAEFMKK